MIELYTTKQDDPKFIELVSRLLIGATVCYRPRDMYVVQLDGWFDHKWKNFAGVIDLQLGVWRLPHTLPPFHPNRVIGQRYFCTQNSAPSDYTLSEAKPLHIKQHSGSNLSRRIKQISDSGLFLWYSGNTNSIDRASIMLYVVEQETELAWYASLMKKEEWKWNKLKGTSKQEIEEIIQCSIET